MEPAQTITRRTFLQLMTITGTTAVLLPNPSRSASTLISNTAIAPSSYGMGAYGAGPYGFTPHTIYLPTIIKSP